MKLTQEHIGKKVRNICWSDGWIRVIALGKHIVEGIDESGDGYTNGYHSDYDWELVPEEPVGLSLLEAMQSGKEFRDVCTDPTDEQYQGWMKVDEFNQLWDVAHGSLVTTTKGLLTARYELKPKPKKAEVTAEMLLEACRTGSFKSYVFDHLRKELGL